MTAMPQPTWNPAPPPQHWGAGRVIALVVGILLLFPALGLLAGGGVLLYGDRSVRDGNGYLFSGSQSFSSPGYAITSTSLDLSTGADWLPVSSALGTARFQVTGSNSGSDVFIGIARESDVSAYLGGVQRSIVTDIGSGSVRSVTAGASAPSTPPTEQSFWTAKASGSGTQTLTWSPTAGNWVLVVMNADGSAGVSVDGRLGATVPALGGLAWGLLAAGLVLLLLGVLAIVLAARRRPAPAVPYGTGVPTPVGPPPNWTPPAPVDRTTAADATRTETPVPPPEVRPGG